jgi:hypothetical protein
MMLRAAITALMAAAAIGPGTALAAGMDGEYAVASPLYDLDRGAGPVLAGRSMVWPTTRDGLSGGIERSDEYGNTTALYAPHGSSYRGLDGLVASPKWVAAMRSGRRDDLIAGPLGAPLRHVMPATRKFRNRRGCGHGMIFLTSRVVLDPPLSISGSRLLYKQRVTCPGQWRRSHWELVLHDLASGRRRVVHRGDVSEARLAGRYFAYDAQGPRGRFEPTERVVVADTRTGKTVYRTPARPFERSFSWPSLDSDGTLATVVPKPGLSLRGTLGWFSPKEPRFHVLPQTMSFFSSEPLLIANGRIAFVRELLPDGYALAITDLQGNSETYGEFRDPEQLADFTFDGRSLAWAIVRYRPYLGSADDGLPYFCDNDLKAHVLARAPVIEVHHLGDPGRLPVEALPWADAAHDPTVDEPSCAYPD